jgi:hypothetical protein
LSQEAHKNLHRPNSRGVTARKFDRLTHHCDIFEIGNTSWRDGARRGNVVSSHRQKAGVAPSHVQTILPLAFLAPSLTRELLDGRRQLSGRR